MSAAAKGRSGPGAGGAVEGLWIKRVRRGPMDAVGAVDLVADQGIVGNANQGGRRQVTLISREAWDAVRSELGAEIDPAARRANVLVRGVDLAESRGRVLRVGACRLRIEGETRPCRLMDEEHPGLQEALDPDWRGGVFAVVVEGGRIEIGDGAAWVG